MREDQFFHDIRREAEERYQAVKRKKPYELNFKEWDTLFEMSQAARDMLFAQSLRKYGDQS